MRLIIRGTSHLVIQVAKSSFSQLVTKNFKVTSFTKIIEI